MECYYTISRNMFSSQFPTMRFERCGYNTINFKFYAGSVTLLDTNLTAIRTNDQETDEVIEIYDIGKLYEQHMRLAGTNEAYLELYVDGELMDDCTIVYCPYNTSMTAEDFIPNRFLTSITAKRIPANATNERLEFIRTSRESGQTLTLTIEATYINEDGYTIYNDSFTRTLGTTLRHTMDVSPATIESMIIQGGVHPEKLLSYKVSLGNRSFIYFVDNEASNLLGFSFKNAFNTTETAYFEGTTTRETKTERNLATMHGVALFYDQQDSEEFEVTTAPLSFEEADWLKQMLLSYDVSKIGGAKILITDMEVKVSDDDTEHKRLKFTYRTAKEGASLPMATQATAVAQSRLFTTQFTLDFA